MTRFRCAVAALLATALMQQASAADVSSLVDTIKSVKREGGGNEAAAAAVKELSAASANELPTVLQEFSGASPLAVNYLRGAVETIVDRQLADGKKLPVAALEKLIADRNGDARARRLAYEIVARVDRTAPERIIPEMLLDPSPDFRRDAVQRLMDQAAGSKDDKVQSAQLYLRALSGATDADQVKAIAKALGDLGEKVNLIRHYGFLTNWRIIGPFNNKEKVGFAQTYPPEEKLDFDAKLEGQLGEVEWDEISTEQEFGILDIAKSIKPYKGAVMYLTTTFDSAMARDVELRLGTPNAWKVWVNGKLLFGRDEYHRGMAIDQYQVNASLKAGSNVILVKLCQNEQTQDWAQRYQLQLRVCDASGIAVHPVEKAAALTKKRATLTAQNEGNN